MIARNFILATAGHVDHGKSSLVKALTGIDPDRLPEEKARGITIDLGFAHVEIAGRAGGEPVTFHLGIVDVPGHEDFVKNMVAGVGSIDLALLIVAADDGWMPQTEEHLQILTYLGVTRAVVALTKIDLAQNENAIQAEVRAKLADSPFSDAPIIPTSVISGRGLAELKAALSAVLEKTPPPRDIGKPRLPIDRVFILRGIGTVVTGTLTGGEFRRGQNVVIQPGGISARIRSLQNHNHEVEVSGPGTRTALNLPDAKVPTGERGIRRGDVITLPEFGSAGKMADVLLERSSRLSQSKTAAARPLKDGTRVRVHIGSGNVAAHVILSEARTLESGGRTLAQLRFEEPMFVFAGDHFIIRDWSEQATLAGGIVLEPDSARKKTPAQVNLLRLRAAAPKDVATLVLTEIQRFRAAPVSRLLVRARFGTNEIAEAVERLAKQNQLVLEKDWVIDAVWWKETRDKAGAIIDSDHRTHPDRPGLRVADFKAAVEKELPHADLFDLLLRDLLKAGFAQTALAIKRATHQLRLPAQLQAAGAKVRQALAAKPFDPPSRKEVAPDSSSQQALRFLVETGEVIDLGNEVILLSSAFRNATEKVRSFLRSRRAATASEIRQELGTSRRVVIPLLERLDKDRVTRREGDTRVLCG